jgi:predicted HAD superfamily Cof-like phosphohydrolase
MKKTHYEQVKEFHEAFGVTNRDNPGFPDLKTRLLRIALIEEELEELINAEAQGDLVEVADALCDLDYVINGMALQYGINLDVCFAEVHASNMSKLGADGKPILREDGKVLKGPGYFRPNLSPLLNLPDE